MAKQQRRDRKTARELFPDDLLVLPIHAADKREVVTQLLNALVIEGVLPLEREDEVRQSILDREEVASTGIGTGVWRWIATIPARPQAKVRESRGKSTIDPKGSLATARPM